MLPVCMRLAVSNDPTIHVHKNDLPADAAFVAAARKNGVAVDSETLGLRPHRDRLCVVQLSVGDGAAHVVQFDGKSFAAPNLKALLVDPQVTKIFHFARFDVAVYQRYLSVVTTPVYCTKIASKLARTYTDKHGLKDVALELAGVVMDKQQQSSDWAAKTLSDEQKRYAAADVLYLHKIKARLDEMLAREGRTTHAQRCFEFLSTRAALDLAGFEDMDLFSHA
jgi:ribonuclease D